MQCITIYITTYSEEVGGENAAAFVDGKLYVVRTAASSDLEKDVFCCAFICSLYTLNSVLLVYTTLSLSCASYEELELENPPTHNIASVVATVRYNSTHTIDMRHAEQNGGRLTHSAATQQRRNFRTFAKRAYAGKRIKFSFRLFPSFRGAWSSARLGAGEMKKHEGERGDRATNYFAYLCGNDMRSARIVRLKTIQIFLYVSRSVCVLV